MASQSEIQRIALLLAKATGTTFEERTARAIAQQLRHWIAMGQIRLEVPSVSVLSDGAAVDNQVAPTK